MKSRIHLCRSYSFLRYKYCSVFVTANNMYYHFAVNRDLRNSIKFRFVLRPVTPKFVVSSSLSSLLTSANAVVAASSAGSGTVHGAVNLAITQVAVTAVAIASGACLSTKVDFLWPKAGEQPGSLVLDGVDVTGYPIFNDAKVQKAIAFARKAHHGQLRMTGDPYLTHCICTGKILSGLVPSGGGKRAVNTVVAGILHDVVDDTSESLSSVDREFGDDVTKLVAGVSRLSYINQYLRRCRRTNENQSTISNEEANNLRVMLLGMVDDPRVVLIKLADRLHNMRTIYALPTTKAKAVAQETLVVWCSLASRLGLWALKAEMEDLCFAVLQPHLFCQMRAVLASMWNPYNKTKGSLRSSSIGHDSNIENEMGLKVDEDTLSIKDLLQAVLPFDGCLDRRRRRHFLHNLQTMSQTKPKVVKDAAIALASLLACEEALERELLISTSYVPGMEVTLSCRLKSLYSIYSKMKRKEVGINKVYDARALRVIIGDKNGTLHGQAVRACYSLLNILHRLWTPIDGEFDDYIINPKPSGYQSLHTAVQGPENSPLEVQIRTQRMHECAEHGHAAHWLYKEADNEPITINGNGSEMNESPYLSIDLGEQSTIREDISLKYRTLKEGHPVLRVEGSHLLTAVIVSIDEGGKQLLVAVSFGLEASESVADRRSSDQIKHWESYARLYKKVSEEWWCESGHGDLYTCLERYTLCRDGMYHKQDQFQRLLPTFIQIIDLTEQEEAEYRSVVSAVLEGKQIEPNSNSISYEKPSSNTDTGISIKVRLLRAMLQWEEQLRYKSDGKYSLGEVAIICWPNGEIMRLEAGSTAADAARRIGHGGKLVSVNGQVVLHNTELKDGDIVEVRG